MAAATRLCFCAHVGHPARMISSQTRCVPQAIENLFVSAAVSAGQVLSALLRGRLRWVIRLDPRRPRGCGGLRQCPDEEQVMSQGNAQRARRQSRFYMDQSKWLPRPYMTRIWFRMAEDAAKACTECSCGGGSLGDGLETGRKLTSTSAPKVSHV
jgi:hypothetical protein